jgi:hypothetical protein
MDLPVWQALYEEVGAKGFVPIAVAFDTRGAEAARPWIEAAKATYPCLVDEHHVVAELYGMVNVPQAVWIDEDGRIVRPTETAGTGDAFRSMDRTNFSIPPEKLAELQGARRGYVAALRDWAEHGAASPFVLPPEEARRRAPVSTPDDARAGALFRMGQHLHSSGQPEAAQGYFASAKQLRPDSWAFKRQAWNLEHPLKSGGPEFWAAVDALASDHYYAPTDIPPA